MKNVGKSTRGYFVFNGNNINVGIAP